MIETVARESYGRLVAYLTAQWGDLARAEDALADAFLSATESWQHTGMPEKPEAWLLTVARRRLIDDARRTRVQNETVERLSRVTEMIQQEICIDVKFPDERLKLLFLCAHPAIDARIHAPLMLQVVLGLDATRIASAFLVRPSTMGQRLSRAKTKIREARISFEIPDIHELSTRVSAVLQAIYACYGSGWEDVVHSSPMRKGLATEALHLGRMMSRLMPEDPEVHGLLALMLYYEARQSARRSPAGRYVPLSDQDATLWSQDLLEEAEHHLEQATKSRTIGRFQLEAAIQSVHADRARTGRTDWDAIAILYEGLVQLAPAKGLLIGRAAAIAHVRGEEEGLRILNEIPIETIKSYQPYWALVAHLLKCVGRYSEARAAYSHAIRLCEDSSVREFLSEQADRD